MKDKLILVTQTHLEAHIAKHRMNIEVMLENPMAIPEHTDIIESIEKELGYISEYQDKLEVLKEYFICQS